MSFIKILLIAFGLILLGMLAFPLIGLVYNLLWYVLWFAVIGIGGYVGYKMLTGKKQKKQLADKSSFAIDEMDNFNRAFEDFKRKHLTK